MSTKKVAWIILGILVMALFASCAAQPPAVEKVDTVEVEEAVPVEEVEEAAEVVEVETEAETAAPAEQAARKK